MGSKEFKFNRMFGLRLTDRLDGTYYSLFIIVTFITALIILRLATLDYSRYQLKAEQEINHKYKAFISQLIVNEVKTVEPGIKNVHQLVIPPAVSIEHNRLPVTIVPESQLKKQRQHLARRISKEQTILSRTKMIGKPGTGAGIASELPAGLADFSAENEDDFFDQNQLAMADAREAVRKIKARARTANPVYQAKTTQVTNFDPGDITKGDVKLFNYVVERKGTAYLDVPEQLVKDSPANVGYRDPTEVEEVVRRYSPMIEYCYRKNTRYAPDARGFIKVAFKVSYEGYVIPESVRIISSTLRNKPLEQCIKNYIKHWRNFKRLDPSMGIAQVVQKFVFN